MNETKQGSEPTQVTATATRETTVLGASVKCPICDTENVPNEQYCGDCGFLLSSIPGESTITKVDQARLVAPDGREYFLHEGENTVGREDADVLLTHPTVSRRHAVLISSGTTWILRDLGSTNGTFVGERQVYSNESISLSNNCEIKFGSVTLRLVLPGTEGETGETSIEQMHRPGAVARLISDKEPFREYIVVSGVNRIGRRAECDIVVEDPYVSGMHAELVADNNGFCLTDIGSTNGTLINGRKIEPGVKEPLRWGDEITLGKTTLKFDAIHGEEAVQVTTTEVEELPSEEQNGGRNNCEAGNTEFDNSLG